MTHTGEAPDGSFIASLEPPELYRIAASPGFLSFAAVQQLYNRNLPWPAPFAVDSEIKGEHRLPIETLLPRDLGLVFVGECDTAGIEGAKVTIENGVPVLDTERDSGRQSKADNEKLAGKKVPFYFEPIPIPEGELGSKTRVFATPGGVLSWSHSGTYHPDHENPWPSGEAPSVFNTARRIYVPDLAWLRTIGTKKEGIDRALTLALMTDFIYRAEGTGRVIIKPDHCQVIVNISGRLKSMETIGGVRVEAILFGLAEIRLATVDGRQLQPHVDRLRVSAGADPFERAVEVCREVIDADAARRPKGIATKVRLLGISP